MENGLFGVPIDMAGRNSVATDRSSQRTPNSLVQFDSFNLNNHSQTVVGFTMLPTLQGEPINDLHASIHLANRSSVMNSEALVTSLGRNCWWEKPLVVALKHSEGIKHKVLFQEQKLTEAKINTKA